MISLTLVLGTVIPTLSLCTSSLFKINNFWRMYLTLMIFCLGMCAQDHIQVNKPYGGIPMKYILFFYLNVYFSWNESLKTNRTIQSEI